LRHAQAVGQRPHFAQEWPQSRHTAISTGTLATHTRTLAGTLYGRAAAQKNPLTRSGCHIILGAAFFEPFFIPPPTPPGKKEGFAIGQDAHYFDTKSIESRNLKQKTCLPLAPIMHRRFRHIYPPPLFLPLFSSFMHFIFFYIYKE
jgi:hypothetical protein